MTTLVTGAGGFIGSHVVDELLARGEAVRALVRDPTVAAGLRARGVEAVVGDVRDPDAVAAAARGAAVVHHCAAAPDEGTNLRGVENLLEALRETGGRAVLITGLSVLGLRDLDPATEGLPYRASGDPGAAAKIRIERLALDCHRRHGVAVTILRPGFVYGPRDRRNLPQLLEALRQGKLVYIGSRDNVVPLVHVADMARAMLLAGAAPHASGRVYHIADGSRTTIGELAEHLARLLGCPPPRTVLPYFLPYTACVAFGLLRRLGLGFLPAPITPDALLFFGTSRFVDIGRARRELGFTPLEDFRRGMAATVRSIQGEHHEQSTVAGPAA